ncbi:lipid-A-disaccharide synthase [Devosia sp.]|uniref:lipid-A-disaccharide synthase n=1 Tax=Devosia sp. TaxID=1871048 RepID=UPI001ACBB7E0|nr:lipid-A-disaccharide synthase [Devosia sp.]MBN9308406.1 lipid-A-disaccharide synthase [Devosia sp.]
MAEPLRLFILAGEASGDRLGADLVRRLGQRLPVQLSGVGGAELEAEGLASMFPMSDLAVMGWSDVLRRLPLLLWRVRQVARAIVRSRPDIVVLIDSQVFSKAVAQRVRRAGVVVPTILYVAPTVWAWRPERAPALRPLFDEVLAILPFEPAAMAGLDGPPTHFVGHPAVARFPGRPAQPERGPLLLLPGSRRGELRRHLPLMRAAVEQFRDHPRVTGFAIPTLDHLLPSLRREVAHWPAPVTLVTGEERRSAWDAAIAAFAVSGTVTLELAMTGIPMVVAYVADPHQARQYDKLGRKVTLALPSIIRGSNVVRELQLRSSAGPFDLSALSALLDDPAAIPAQLAAFAEVRALMQKGAPEAPLADVVDRVLAHAPQRLLIGS